MSKADETGSPPAPAPPPDAGALPHALTIFLSAHQRTRVLAALARINEDRAVALCRVLGVLDGLDQKGRGEGIERRHKE